MSFNKKLILNEGYAPNGTYFTSGIGSNIYINKKIFGLIFILLEL